jgi:hypothetical protein
MQYCATGNVDHDIDIFINDKWRKYVGGDIG